jgi:hypothetical protein
VPPASPGVQTNSRFVFFILGAGRQVGRIDKSDRGWIQGRTPEKFPNQVIVNLAKTSHPQPSPKIVKHAYIGNRKSVGQVRESAPDLLLGQATHERIETKSTREQNQQVNSPQLSRAEAQTPAFAPLSCKARIDEIIGNIRRKNSQEFTRADSWKFHAFYATQ